MNEDIKTLRELIDLNEVCIHVDADAPKNIKALRNAIADMERLHKTVRVLRVIQSCSKYPASCAANALREIKRIH